MVFHKFRRHSGMKISGKNIAHEKFRHALSLVFGEMIVYVGASIARQGDVVHLMSPR